MKFLIKTFLPVIILGIFALATIYLPRDINLQPCSISGNLPLEYDLPFWHGTRTQESKAERGILAPDTRFFKANYRRLSLDDWNKKMPDINVSVVISGNDMNNSIHRPELCLPAQGFLNLHGTPDEIKLSDGRIFKVTKLSSFMLRPDAHPKRLHFIHYYFFIGHHRATHSHASRNFFDIQDRLFKGYGQRWSYFQAGCYWSEELGISEQDTVNHLKKLIGDLLPVILLDKELQSDSFMGLNI